VSTENQDLSAQLDVLRAAGAVIIYRQKVSGVRADRPQLARQMAIAPQWRCRCRHTKLDRLGR
jgi:DNA invertase Pin-like site-specific DNA recombinase